MAIFHKIMAKVWLKYRKAYLADQLLHSRSLAVARIKGVFKLSMARFYGQMKERKE